MSKLLLSLLVPLMLWSSLFDYKKVYSLKKDEVAKILVTKRDTKEVQEVRFRWTLYSDKKLVLLVKYDDFPTQYLLQKEYKRNSIRIYLRDDYQNIFKRAYLVLNFVSFDEGKDIATINAMVSDPNRELEIDFDK